MHLSLPQPETRRSIVWIDIFALFLAGFVNSALALIDAIFVFGPGTLTQQPDLLLRAQWISENTTRWQAGWFFWFVVTLTFAWSYFALGRHLTSERPWVALAVGVGLIAAAVDLVGVLVNIVVLPEIATALLAQAADAQATTLAVVFQAFEQLSNAMTNVTAYGLYSVAGALLLPAAITTADYPRWLLWLGVVEWNIALISTALLVLAPAAATIPLVISFVLYSLWVWGSAAWLYIRTD